MEQQRLVSDNRYELEAYEEAGGEDSREVDDDAGAVALAALAGVVVAFAGCGATAL